MVPMPEILMTIATFLNIRQFNVSSSFENMRRRLIYIYKQHVEIYL